jgi:hypothetical protein
VAAGAVVVAAGGVAAGVVAGLTGVVPGVVTTGLVVVVWAVAMTGAARNRAIMMDGSSIRMGRLPIYC